MGGLVEDPPAGNKFWGARTSCVTSGLLRTEKMVAEGICPKESSRRRELADGTHCICSASVGFSDIVPDDEGHRVQTPPTLPNCPLGHRIAVLARQYG